MQLNSITVSRMYATRFHSLPRSGRMPNAKIFQNPAGFGAHLVVKRLSCTSKEGIGEQTALSIDSTMKATGNLYSKEVSLRNYCIQAVLQMK